MLHLRKILILIALIGLTACGPKAQLLLSGEDPDRDRLLSSIIDQANDDSVCDSRETAEAAAVYILDNVDLLRGRLPEDDWNMLSEDGSNFLSDVRLNLPATNCRLRLSSILDDANAMMGD